MVLSHYKSLAAAVRTYVEFEIASKDMKSITKESNTIAPDKSGLDHVNHLAVVLEDYAAAMKEFIGAIRESKVGHNSGDGRSRSSGAGGIRIYT